MHTQYTIVTHILWWDNILNINHNVGLQHSIIIYVIDLKLTELIVYSICLRKVHQMIVCTFKHEFKRMSLTNFVNQRSITNDLDMYVPI